MNTRYLVRVFRVSGELCQLSCVLSVNIDKKDEAVPPESHTFCSRVLGEKVMFRTVQLAV